jgi:protein RecA
MERKKRSEKLSTQMKNHSKEVVKDEELLMPGNFDVVVSTGSTLLDLSISGKRIRGGGLPGGIVVEAFGPSQSGKTALLCEIAGNTERQGGDTMFKDPEARLDAEFANIFGMNINPEKYDRPNTIPELFDPIVTWKPKSKVKGKVIHAILGDSLAALSTNLEMEEDEGDKMGMRRAKEFSEQLRKTCRIIADKNYILACSNQIRVNVNGGKYNPYTTTGGKAFEFYASVRLKFNTPDKIDKEITIAGKKKKKIIGIETEIEVVKTVDEPYRKCKVVIMYGYGIDDIRANLQYIKDNTNHKDYTVNGEKVGDSMEDAVAYVENNDLVSELKNQVIDLWEEIQEKFKIIRKPKR